MKFPLRLTLDLWLGRLAGGAKSLAPVHHLPAALLPVLHENGLGDRSALESHSAADSVRIARRSKAPVLWIGGGEPLDHAEVGRVSFALNARGRNVFVHTNGLQLRRRIHEFRPDPRLFLTVELKGREAFHDRMVRQPGAFRRVIEGLRAAKLSGFHTCAHVSVTEQTEPCETGELFEFLDRYDVDGYLVSSGGRSSATASSVLREKLDELRGLVRCSRWEGLSKLLETSYADRAADGIAPVPASALPAEPDARAVEETA
jgi:MoaA/NifB/PqqE/SkfB family radical SAM enzyme